MATLSDDELGREFTRLFGHDDFRPGQREIVEGVLAGRDTLAILPTGGGKSVTYQLPAMLTDGATLILSPLIALMKDQVGNLPPAVAERTTLINSTLDPGEVGRRLSLVKAGRLKLVYAAPERLRQPTFLHALRRANISMVVIDEAHCISQWGHDFRPDYRAVGKAIAALNPRTVLAVTATATPEVAGDIEKEIGRPLHRILRPTFRDNLRLTCRKVANEDEKLQATLEYCRDTPGAGLVYATSREKCEQLARMLKRYGVEAGFYHAGLPPEERAAAQDRFMRGDVRVMAATVAFGMGVDKSDIRFLVHYNPSRTLENYYQEAGRAGRDGEPSECIVLHSAPDATNALRRVREDTLEMADLQGVYKTLKQYVGATRIGTVSWDDLFSSMNGDAGRVRSTLPVLEEVGLIARHADVPRRFAVYPEYTMIEEEEPIAEWQNNLAGVVGGGGEWEAAALADGSGISLRDLEEIILRCQDAGHVTYRALGGREPLFEILPTPPDVKARMEAMLRERAEGATEKAQAMVAYAKDRKCRHGQIARYFGDRWANVPCGRCDVCSPTSSTTHPEADEKPTRSPRASSSRAPRASSVEGTISPPLAALTLIYDLTSGRSPFAMGKSGVVRSLRGTPDAPIRPERSAMFGVLADFKKAELERLTDALVEQGYLSRDDNDEYRRLYLTTQGKDAVRDEQCDMEWRVATSPKQKIPLAGTERESASDSSGDEDAVLFETLRAWRREQAEAENVPPFVIFADKVLHGIATRKPTNEFDLQDVPGIGPSKAAKFGEMVLDIVRQHNRNN